MSYQDFFWIVWGDNQPDLSQSIIKYARMMRYQGDPRDVVHDVMLSAYRDWNSYDERRSAFKTWVLQLTKRYISNLYNSKGVGMGPMLGHRPAPDYEIVGLSDLEIRDESTQPEDIIIEEERRVQIWALIQKIYTMHRDTRAGWVLEAMAALIDKGLKPSLRNIAAIVGCSHSQVATELAEIRKTLQNLDMTI